MAVSHSAVSSQGKAKRRGRQFSKDQLRHGRGFTLLLCTCSRNHSHSTAPAAGPQKGKAFLQYLCDRFYDIESLVEVGMKLKSWNVERKNKHNIQIREKFGDNLAAAAFALMLKGGIRFQGQTEWYRESNQKRYCMEIIQYQGVPLEALDFSGSVINYDGLASLVNLKALKHLDLSRCPHIDDWSLSRLHVFGDTLQELSLAGCPQITERGLACLHHLESLRRLDVSELPSVAHKGFVRILLEEMLPRCEIVGIHYDDELSLCLDSDTHHGEIEEVQRAACVPKNSEIPA